MGKADRQAKGNKLPTQHVVLQGSSGFGRTRSFNTASF